VFVGRAPIVPGRINCSPEGVLRDGTMIVRCFKTISETRGSYEYVRFTRPAGPLSLVLDDSMDLGPEMGYHQPAIGIGARYMYRGDPESYEIRAFRPDGKLARIIRIKLQVHVLTEAELERQREVDVERAVAMGAPEERARAESKLHRMPHRIAVWVFVKEDPDGNIWAQENRVPWDLPRRWMVFDSTGRLLGRMETPPMAQVYEIGRDYMILGTEDADGAPVLKVVPLVKVKSE
jgi:hypothetical protein